jgi:hypothetical protein
VKPPSIEQFFSPPNTLKVAALIGAPGELVTRLVANVEGGNRSLLPARIGPVTRWYGVAPDSRQERILREELRAWLGPPISDILTVSTPRDDMDRRAQTAFAGWGLLVADVDELWQEAARENVTRLLDVWAMTPERATVAPRPVGRVLRQFYEAVLGGVREDAESALTELRARALINATNLRFLRVQMLSELDAPQALRDDDQLQGITLLARPPGVTERLASAAEALIVQPAVDAGDPPEAIGRELERVWPGLVAERHQVTTLASAHCLALAEIVALRPRRPLLSEIAETFLSDPLLEAIARDWGAPVEPSVIVSAVEHYHRGEYDVAVKVAEADPISRSSVSVALAAAVNLSTGEAAARAIALFESLPPGDQQALRQNAVESGFLDRLEALTSESRIPSGWLDWLRGDWSDRPDLLVDWAHGWPSPTVGHDQQHGELAIELLAGLNDHRRGRIRNGLPVFVTALLEDELSAGLVPVAVTVFDIVLSSEPGRLERQAALSLLDEILYVGSALNEYVEILNALDAQLTYLGPRDAAWLIQVVDLLTLHSSPDAARRESSVSLARSTALAWRDRLDRVDAQLLDRIYPDAGFADSPSVEEAQAPDESRPATVGIYSLLESATRQAAVWIRVRWPDVVVRTSSDHVNSDALGALARGVDVLLVQTSHAKHAATQAIEAAVPDRSRLLLVNGRGASAIVRALWDWAASKNSTG